MIALKGCPFKSTACSNKHQEEDALLYGAAQALSAHLFMFAGF